MHDGELDLARVEASVTSSRGRDKPVTILPSALWLEEREISPAPVTTTKSVKYGTVESPFRVRRWERSVLSMSPKLDQKTIREENEALFSVVSEYRVDVKNLEKNVDDKKLNGMSFLRELKLSK